MHRVQVSAITPGSLYAKLGFRNGDTVTKVGGYSVNSPEAALEAYTKMRGAKTIEVELLRGEVIVKHWYFIAES